MTSTAEDSGHDCLFCGIATGTIPADIVADDDLALAFRDVDPQAPTHLLVIPRQHSVNLPELARDHPESALAVLAMARSAAIGEGLEPGYRLVCNNGAAAQQTVFHAHLHVLGGRDLSWPPG